MRFIFLKNFTLTAATLLSLSAIVACGDDDDSDSNTSGSGSGSGASSTLILRQQSIANGAEVDAATTTVLTLSFNTTVKVASADGITINNVKAAATTNAKTSMAIDIPLLLQEGSAYTVKLAKGALQATGDANMVNAELTISFTTKAKVQPVNPDIALTPVTATTNAAKRLYSYFLEQYGQKTISSVMANVNWNNECADKVYKLTGKYPAMNCYDFIHVCFSPANWIDYTSITPVQQWVNAGGIVQLMWHFNVPKQEGSSDVTCTPSETTFRAKNVFTEGSWENKWFYGQMDKVVATMLKLQDAGIAATWRPFHEAAGNSTAKQQANWTKSWFWWGYDGADVCKKLWITMFDYFRQKGINNLIWVWTTQNYNGNSSQYNQDTDWYPGDQYVDIVARDLYGYTADQNLQEFNEIQARYPNKMVVLGECGCNGNTDADPSKPGDFWSAGAKWGHFMVWYQGGHGSTDTMCSDSWWKAAMSNANVITRDQLPNLK